jgi:tetratricopeptide (TPR) repeat protein
MRLNWDTMISVARVKIVLSYVATGILSGVIAVGLYNWLIQSFEHDWAEVALVMANDEYSRGHADKATMILSQATAKDPNFYEPFKELGKIYSERGNKELALEMYKKAFSVFDRERFQYSPSLKREELESIRQNIDSLLQGIKIDHQHQTPHRS